MASPIVLDYLILKLYLSIAIVFRWARRPNKSFPIYTGNHYFL